MCGIVGIISRKTIGLGSSDMDLIQNLLLLDQLRGDDSTGVFTVFRDRQVSITKIGSHPSHLFSTKEWGKLRTKAISSGRMVIGHNRKATTGAVNSTNAHPFHENNIVLVHNGTLRGDHKKLAETEVDSHAVCHAFNEKGAEVVIPTLDAAFAFVWWDIAKNKLFAVRNTERPLSLVITEDLNILCSEPWMATCLLQRAGRKVETVIDLTPGTVFEFSMDGTYTTHTVELKKYTPVVYTGHSHYGGHHHRRDFCGFSDLEDDDTVGCTTNPKPSGGTTLTPFEGAANALIAASQKSVKHDDYKAGDKVLVRVRGLQKGVQYARARVNGIVTEPYRETMDFVAFLQEGLTDEEQESYIDQDCLITMASIVPSSCGASMWGRDIVKSPMVKLHNTDVPHKVWEYVVASCSCKDCDHRIYDVDSRFTSVSKRIGGWRVTCADCIQDKLTGEVKNEFEKRRFDAIQAGLAEQPKSTKQSLTLVKPSDSPTLH